METNVTMRPIASSIRAAVRLSAVIGTVSALGAIGLLQPAAAAAISSVESPHFVSSNPRHGASIRSAPGRVVLRFDFDLAQGSSIVIRRGARRVNGSTTIVDGNLGLRTSLTSRAAGRYTVTYTACWPDGSCHPGRFHFDVRRR